MIFCPSCGANVKPNVNFCAKCGASLGSAATPPLQNPSPMFPSGSSAAAKSLLALSADSVFISGEHYTVSNGYISKANGEVRFPISSIISAECVKRRSKRVMYATLLIMGIALAIITPIRNTFNSINAAVNDIFWGGVGAAAGVGAEIAVIGAIPGAGLPDILPEPEFGGFTLTEIFVIIFIVFAIPSTIVGIIYFFTGRRFVELTTMQGTYRVAIPRKDTSMENIVRQLRQQI